MEQNRNTIASLEERIADCGRSDDETRRLKEENRAKTDKKAIFVEKHVENVCFRSISHVENLCKSCGKQGKPYHKNE